MDPTAALQCNSIAGEMEKTSKKEAEVYNHDDEKGDYLDLDSLPYIVMLKKKS